MMGQIIVDLMWKTDKTGKKYLVGDPGVAAQVDLSKVVFFVWPNDESSEDFPTMVIKARSSRDRKVS